MIFQVEVNGVFATNAYFYIDDTTNHGVLIDPGAEAGKLLHVITERGFNIERILLTHGHFDHTGAAMPIQRRLNIPICMYKRGVDYVTNAEWNLSRSCGLNIVLNDVTYLEDGAEITSDVAKDFNLKMIATPGHTTDSVIYYNAADHVAFVGDTIFQASYGRTDFYGGNEADLFKSITQKILTLPDETILLSGHSAPTTVADEKTRPWYQF